MHDRPDRRRAPRPEPLERRCALSDAGAVTGGAPLLGAGAIAIGDPTAPVDVPAPPGDPPPPPRDIA